MKKSIMLSTSLLLCLAACASEESTKVTAIQKQDKELSCREILLEQNEAEFYRQTAAKNKGPKMKNLLMPLGYISTYMSAEEAINSADARNQYLQRIYDILDCDTKLEVANRRNDMLVRRMKETRDIEEEMPVAYPMPDEQVMPRPLTMNQSLY